MKLRIYQASNSELQIVYVYSADGESLKQLTGDPVLIGDIVLIKELYSFEGYNRDIGECFELEGEEAEKFFENNIDIFL